MRNRQGLHIILTKRLVLHQKCHLFIGACPSFVRKCKNVLAGGGLGQKRLFFGKSRCDYSFSYIGRIIGGGGTLDNILQLLRTKGVQSFHLHFVYQMK